MNHIEAMKQALEALELMVTPRNFQTHQFCQKAYDDLRQAIEQAEEKNCKNCVIDKPCIAKGKDMQICGAFVSKHAKELKQIALDKKAENARGLGLDYEPAQAEKQEPVKMVAYNCLCGRIMKFESVNGIVAPQRELNCVCGAVWEGDEMVCVPHKREWAGLTQQDIDIAFDDTQEGGGFNEFAEAIEQILRRKNT